MLKIISGGQTGVDIAAIDAAISTQTPYGGMIPKGRKREIGRIPLKYSEFIESLSHNYMVRTEYNVMNSDATLIFNIGELTSGTLQTYKLIKKYSKQCIVIRFDESEGLVCYEDLIIAALYDIKILNVAGPRESKCPGIYDKVFSVMVKTLNKMKGSRCIV